MSKGVLWDYTRGSDGLFRKFSTFGTKTVEHVRDERGQLIRVHHIEADATGRTTILEKYDWKYENVA